jgi:hypothetical protein
MATRLTANTVAHPSRRFAASHPLPQGERVRKPDSTSPQNVLKSFREGITDIA